MANNVYTYATAPSRYGTKARTSNPCPECGGLECLCRPRFFAGQLLTDEELNGLEQYVINKNKLHNRYLHGWGVACGLEVLCHPCDNLVTVTPGYALSPCGDDIIVCKDDAVDVCALIKKCRDKERQDCEPFGSRTDNGCRDLEEKWLLAICYDEKLSRGITALKAAGPSRCGCGGGAKCGCQGQAPSNGTAKTSQPSFSSRVVPQCEPTILCEGYRFKMFKAPVQSPDNRGDAERGALVTRYLECLNALVEVIPPPPTANDLNQLRNWCCALKDSLQEFFITHPGYDCLLPQRLAALCPQPDPNTTPDAYRQAILNQLTPILAEYLRYCLCSALLPPCPEPAENACVPLATITVRKSDCRIIKICNWEGRKFVTTFPNLQYWLSWLPFTRDLRESIATACCRTLQRRDIGIADIATVSTTRFGMKQGPPVQRENTKRFATLAFEAMANRTRVVDTQTLAAAALGLTDKEGRTFMSEPEVENPLEFLLLNELVRPMLVDVMPERAAEALGTFVAGVAARGATAEAVREEEIKNLKAQLEELQKTMQRQQERLDEFAKKKK